MQSSSTIMRAAGAIVISSLFMAAVTVIAKGLSGRFEAEVPIHPLQVGFGRFLFSALLWTSIWFVTRQKFTKVHLGLHTTRVFLGYSTSTAIFWAASLMTLADATAIGFLSPVITLALAATFLGERVGWVRWSAVAVMIAGVMILLRPGTAAFQPAALIALFAACMGGCEAIAIKMLSSRERLLQILFVNNIIGLVLATTMASLVWVWPTGIQWAQMAMVGLGMAGAQLFFVWAMRQAEASVIMPFIYFSLIFATGLDYWIFGDLPDFWAGVGAVVIVMGGVFLAAREAYRQRRADQGS